MAKRTAFGILIAVAIMCGSALAQAHHYGVGLILFEPSGVTARAWLGRSAAIDGAVGWSAERGYYLHIHADFLFYETRLARDRNLALSFYLGAGGKIIFRDEESAWFRIPLGLDFLLQRSPLEFFFELIPSFNFSQLKVFGAVGFRYVFNR
ncbi:MAG: hypothetical protein AB1715_08645 [Acidobacteriota bacterium]